ncbi:hypothetical protein L7F22_018263 [Adiantum nelumboides]|nr:hypothetical protein [Adiantum nelumboides]
MRQLWRVLSTLRLSTVCEQGPVAWQWSYGVSFSRSFWKPAFEPLPSRFAQWRTPLLPQSQPSLQLQPQLAQRRTFASKLKKYKLKSYTAFKGRFKLKANGEYKRWKAGKRHNAHSKIVYVEGKKNVGTNALFCKPQVSVVMIISHHDLDDMRSNMRLIQNLIA